MKQLDSVYHFFSLSLCPSLSVYLSVCLYVSVYTEKSNALNLIDTCLTFGEIQFSVSLSVYLFADLSVCLSVCLFICLSSYLYVYLSVYVYKQLLLRLTIVMLM